jgi:mono/diheme cytochrome c family protein
MRTATSLLAGIAIATALSAAHAGGAASQPGGASAPAASQGQGSASGAPYKVVDGYKVDPETLKGFRAWRAAVCDRCHGANQEGSVGPSMIESLKRLSKQEFVEIVTNGRQARGMPGYKTNATVMENIDQLYAYLKGRSDGAITQAKVEPIQ